MRTVKAEEVESIDVVLGHFLPTNKNDLRVTFFGPNRTLMHAGRRTKKLRVKVISIIPPLQRAGVPVSLPRMTERKQDPKAKLGGGVEWPASSAHFLSQQIKAEFPDSTMEKSKEEKAGITTLTYRIN